MKTISQNKFLLMFIGTYKALEISVIYWLILPLIGITKNYTLHNGYKHYSDDRLSAAKIKKIDEYKAVSLSE